MTKINDKQPLSFIFIYLQIVSNIFKFFFTRVGRTSPQDLQVASAAVMCCGNASNITKMEETTSEMLPLMGRCGV